MKLILAALSITLTAPAVAQDIAPVFDLPTMARGQVISSTAKAQARRHGYRRSGDRRPVVTRANCDAKERSRAKLGASHPGVKQLYAICARQEM